MTVLTLLPLNAQDEYTNRYAMKLSKQSDGSFALINKEKYSKRVDLEKIPDLLTPFIYKPTLIIDSDYNDVVTKEYIYKSYPEYDLKLQVDFAETKKSSPFMVYIHGGGWARGDFNANKDISKYCAKKGGITGIRISYTLADKPNATIEITIEDVKDAFKWIINHSKDLNINPHVFGFMGGSAGGHLSAVAAMTIPESKVLVGVSGIYNLTKASITSKATDKQRIRYFENLNRGILEKSSPVYLIPKNNIPSCYLIHGTGDITVEYEQSIEFADSLRNNGCKKIRLEIYPYYDHNINSTKSDLKEKLLLETFNFIVNNLK